MVFYGIDVTKTSFTAYFLPPGNSAVTDVKPFSLILISMLITHNHRFPCQLLLRQRSVRSFFRNISPASRIPVTSHIITGAEQACLHSMEEPE